MELPDYLKSQIDDLDHKIEEAKQLASDPSMAEMASAEIKRLEEEKQMLISSSSLSPLAASSSDSDDPDAKWDNRNIILEIRGAAGGEEAKMWGDDLLNNIAVI